MSSSVDMADTPQTGVQGEAPPRLPQLAQAALARDPSRAAIEYDGRWHSWGELRAVAEGVSRRVEAADVAPHAPVGLVARNHPAMVAALLGLLAEGRTIQMIYAFQSPAVIARDVATLMPAALVALASDMTDPVRGELARHGIAGIALDGMGARAEPGFERAARREIAPLEPQIQVLTSGTTGPPKRFPIPYVMIERHHLGNSGMAGAIRAGEEGPPFLLFFPLGNISGIYSIIPTMIRGQRVRLMERFTLDGWRDFIRRYRPAAGGLPPSAFRLLLDADVPPEELSSIKVMATGAAPLDPIVHKAFEDRYGIPVMLSYGATEFGGPVAAMTPALLEAFGTAKLGTVGRAMPGARLRVVDPVSGTALPPGEEGLLEVVSPRIGPDWIRTSDIAVIDRDGFLFIRGRADGAIMRGGFKILPETIERALLLHPGIGAAAVVAVPDRRLGQVPAAAIQLKAGAAPLDAASAEAHLRGHVPSTHVPVHWAFVEELPKNPSMKIDRPGVKALFAKPEAGEDGSR